MRIFMPADEHESMRALSDDQIQQFIRDGFVRIDRAFPRELADEARTILWRDTGCDPHDQATWAKPVIRLSGYKDAPFLKAERTPVLHAAFDQIVGEGRWCLGSLGFGGTFVVRFPHPDEPGDDGWHIDTSFSPDGGDPNERRANVRSRGRNYGDSALNSSSLFIEIVRRSVSDGLHRENGEFRRRWRIPKWRASS